MSRESRTRLTPELWSDFFRGERIACAQMISLVENRPELLAEIRHELFLHRKNAIRIGITGPPGVGKSTVTAALALEARRADLKTAIIAVDPSSPFSGGAFLGDRIRMQDLMGDPDVFIRSLASRDGHGGLSPSTPYVAEVFDGFGMDWIIIETVGVGQAELDVLNCADVVMVVLQPGTGDVIQALKAGIMEAGDLFLINKADQPGVDMVQESLRFIFQMEGHRPGYNPPPVLAASAFNGAGIPELFLAVQEIIEKSRDEGKLLLKREERLAEDIKREIRRYLWRQYLDFTGAEEEIRREASILAKTGDSPFPYINELKTRIVMDKKK